MIPAGTLTYKNEDNSSFGQVPFNLSVPQSLVKHVFWWRDLPFDLYDPDAAAKPVEPPVWRPLGTINRAVEALLRSTRSLIDAALYFGIAVLPILLVVIGLPLLLIMAAGRALRNRKPKAAPATPAAPVAPVAPTANKPDAQ